jgi:hypothetical protein
MSPKRLFIAILAIYLVLAIGYSVAMPLGEAPDEADHYAYLRYIGIERSLPEGTEITQSKHPPVYYATAAALTAWTGLDFSFLRSNPDALPLGRDKPPNLFVHTTLESFPWRDGALAMHLARFLSILLGAVTVWGTWRLGSVSFPAQPAIGLLAAAFLAGLPGFLFIAGSINNDNAAAACGTIVLLLCAITLRRAFDAPAAGGLAWSRAALLGIFLSLGLLSKVGTLALWPLPALAIGVAWWRHPNRRRVAPAALGQLALTWGLALLLASPWLIRNTVVYGDPLGWDLVAATVDERMGPFALRELGWLLWGFHRTFWGRFGGAGQIELPMALYAIAAAITAVLVAGAVSAVARQVKTARTQDNRVEPVAHLVLLALAPALVFLSVVRYSAIALGTDQVRLMFPALAALAVWVGIGVTGVADWWRVESGGWRVERRLVIGSAVGMAVFGATVLMGVIRPAFAPPEPVAPAGSQSGESLARVGENLRLVGAQLPSEAVPAGEPTALRLLWSADRPVAEDLRPTVRLVHQDGWLAAEWSHSPAGGRYATDRWRPGEVIADDYLIVPQPASPGTYRVEVAVRPFGGDWLAAQGPAADEASVLLGTITYRE